MALSKIFTDYHKLSLGTNAEEVNDYDEFIHVKGFLNDSWYNYIVPKDTTLSSESKEKIEEIIADNKKNGIDMSYYINESFVESYKNNLESEGYKEFGSDNYMVKMIENKEDFQLSGDYQFSNDYDFGEYSTLLVKCFYDWDNEKSYCERYEDYKTSGQKDREFVTYVIKHSDEISAAASITIDKAVNLGYFHNDGTSEDHRRKGLQSAFIIERCNYCFSHGINRALALVEFESGSYWSYKKAGFNSEDRFFVFSK